MANGLDALLSADQTRMIITIAEQGSFNKAAECLGVRQSAVSQQVVRIEGLTGRRLFNRTRAGVKLTHDGEAVLIYSRAVAKLGVDLRRQLASSDADLVLRIGLSEDFARTALPAVLGLFARQYPKLRFQARSASAPEVLFDALDRHELDLVVGQRILHSPRGEVLWSGPSAWVGRADLTLPIQDPVPLVLTPAGGAIRTLTLEALRSVSRLWRVVFESSDVATLEAALRAGLGVAACPIRTEFLDLVILDEKAGLPELAPSVFVYEQAASASSDAINTFCEALRAAARLSFAPDAWKRSA